VLIVVAIEEWPRTFWRTSADSPDSIQSVAKEWRMSYGRIGESPAFFRSGLKCWRLTFVWSRGVPERLGKTRSLYSGFFDQAASQRARYLTSSSR